MTKNESNRKRKLSEADQIISKLMNKIREFYEREWKCEESDPRHQFGFRIYVETADDEPESLLSMDASPIEKWVNKIPEDKPVTQIKVIDGEQEKHVFPPKQLLTDLEDQDLGLVLVNDEGEQLVHTLEECFTHDAKYVFNTSD
jgi:hypothetical protein